MRRIHILILMNLVVYTISGCSDDMNEQSYYIEPYYDPGSTGENCCGVTYGTIIDGVAPSGGRYYWVALMRGDTLVSYGEPTFIGAGSYDNVSLEVSVSHLDNIEAGTHRQVIFASEQLEEVGIIHRRTMTADASLQEIVSYADSFCVECCTNESNGGKRRYKAYAFMGVANPLAVAADIDTKYGRLCGQGTSTADDSVPAQQNCFTGIVQHSDPYLPNPYQAQLGWVKYRDTALAGKIDSCVYYEVSQNPFAHFFVPIETLVPDQNSSHEYKVIRVDDTLIEFYYDGSFVDHMTAPEWRYELLNVITWQGEISGRETDLPGTYGTECFFEDCEYRIPEDTWWHIPEFDPDLTYFNIGVTPQTGNRPDEWGISYSDGRLWIWDKVPMSGGKNTKRM